MRWWKLVLVVLGVPLAVLMAFVGWVYVSFSGGLDDVLDLDHPQEGDPEVVAAQARALDDVPVVSDEVRRTMTDALESAESSAVGGTPFPQCEVGQHNFKIDDDFDLSCTLADVGVVAAPTVPETVATHRRVEGALRRQGWRPVGPRDVPSYDAARFAPQRYVRVSDGQTWQLLVDEADLSSLSYELRGLASRQVGDDASDQRASLEELVAWAPRDGYAVVVGVSVEYFRD